MEGQAHRLAFFYMHGRTRRRPLSIETSGCDHPRHIKMYSDLCAVRNDIRRGPQNYFDENSTRPANRRNPHSAGRRPSSWRATGRFPRSTMSRRNARKKRARLRELRLEKEANTPPKAPAEGRPQSADCPPPIVCHCFPAWHIDAILQSLENKRMKFGGHVCFSHFRTLSGWKLKMRNGSWASVRRVTQLCRSTARQTLNLTTRTTKIETRYR